MARDATRSAIVPGPGGTESPSNSDKAENAQVPTHTADVQPSFQGRPEGMMRLVKKLDYVPSRCRWDEEHPPSFGWAMCMLFAFAACFTVSNLYYNHPILNILADEFNVSYEEVSRIPTLMQAGYAAGLLFLCPIGDIIRRRPFLLGLVFFTACIWLGLCLTSSFSLFLGLSFLAALTTVTPQLMLPLVAELAPPKRRAMMISVVYGGLLMGIILARILSGIVTQFTSWRVIYFISLGIQYLLLVLLFFYFPDYPRINDDVSYFQILWTILTIPTRQPLLVQTSCIAFLTSAVFVSYWTTLTFLLASPPYSLNTLDIGLFAFIGMPPLILNPWISHALTSRYHPFLATIIALLVAFTGVCIGTFIGEWTIAGPIIMGFMVDLGCSVSQTACRTLLVHVEPKARNRVNTVYMVSGFCGMLMGTAVGNALYARGGWVDSGAADVAFIGTAILVVAVRGPWVGEKAWAGWKGGWNMRARRGEVKEGEKKEGQIAISGDVEDVFTQVETSEGQNRKGME